MRGGCERCGCCRELAVGIMLKPSWATGCVATPRPLSQGKAVERRVSLRVVSVMRIGHVERQEPVVVDESPSRTRPLEPSIELFRFVRKLLPELG